MWSGEKNIVFYSFQRLFHPWPQPKTKKLKLLPVVEDRWYSLLGECILQERWLLASVHFQWGSCHRRQDLTFKVLVKSVAGSVNPLTRLLSLLWSVALRETQGCKSRACYKPGLGPHSYVLLVFLGKNGTSFAWCVGWGMAAWCENLSSFIVRSQAWPEGEELYLKFGWSNKNRGLFLYTQDVFHMGIWMRNYKRDQTSWFVHSGPSLFPLTSLSYQKHPFSRLEVL